jgi:hypothetical protein
VHRLLEPLIQGWIDRGRRAGASVVLHHALKTTARAIIGLPLGFPLRAIDLILEFAWIDMGFKLTLEGIGDSLLVLIAASSSITLISSSSRNEVPRAERLFGSEEILWRVEERARSHLSHPPAHEEAHDRAGIERFKKGLVKAFHLKLAARPAGKFDLEKNGDLLPNNVGVRGGVSRTVPIMIADPAIRFQM